MSAAAPLPKGSPAPRPGPKRPRPRPAPVRRGTGLRAVAVPAALTRPVARPVVRPVARPVARPAASNGVFVLVVAGVLALGLLGLLALNTVIAQSSFVAHDLTNQAEDLAVRQQALQQEVARLEAPDQLARQARALGLVPAESPVFLDLASGRILGVPTPAKRPPVAAAPTPSATARPSARPTAAGAAR